MPGAIQDRALWGPRSHGNPCPSVPTGPQVGLCALSWGPLQLGIWQEPQEDHPPRSRPTPVASPRACTHGHQPQAWGAESFRRPQRRGTDQGSENVPRHHPANQSSPLTGTGDRGPGQLSFPPTCVTGSWPLREGGLRQTGNPGLATPWQPSSEPGPGVGGLEGTPRGTGGFIFQVPAWSHSGGSGPIRGCKGQCGVRAQYSSEQPSGAASLSPYAEAPEAQKGEATCLRPHSESGCLLHGAGTGPLGRSRMTLNVLS